MAWQFFCDTKIKIGILELPDYAMQQRSAAFFAEQYSRLNGAQRKGTQRFQRLLASHIYSKLWPLFVFKRFSPANTLATVAA